MTAERGSKIPKPHSAKSASGFDNANKPVVTLSSAAPNFHLAPEADLGGPETGGLDWPNTTAIIRPDPRARRRSVDRACADCPNSPLHD